MPKYTDKVKNVQDINKVRHLMKSGSRMSTVLWECSLRDDYYVEGRSRSKEVLDETNQSNVKYLSQGKTSTKDK